MQALQFKLIYTTPYDVFETFFISFPWLTEVKESLMGLLLFAFTIPDVTHEKSQNVFYATFLALCEVKSIELTELQRNIVKSHIVEQNEVN